MKVLRQIKPVSIFHEVAEENKISLTEFDNDPDYYKIHIQPMLAVGHEGELLNWLKTMGVLQQNQTCNNIIDDIPCTGLMSWAPAKILDQYQLKCKVCSKKTTIRSKSIFQDIKCHFRDVIRLLVGWCKGVDEETMSRLLCIKKQSVVQVYHIASKIAAKYINSNLLKWQIGRPERIVLIDTYPEGLTKFENYKISSNTIAPILCIMEVQRMPQRYWLQALDRYNIHNVQQIQNTNAAALEIIKDLVVPGSILVTNAETSLCSHEVLQSLKHLYPIIVTIDDLKTHNTSINDVIENLELIWQPAITACHKAFKYNLTEMQNHLISNLWQQEFQKESFEMLLNQMYYNFV